jgi:hypothetical protein
MEEFLYQGHGRKEPPDLLGKNLLFCEAVCPERFVGSRVRRGFRFSKNTLYSVCELIDRDG